MAQAELPRRLGLIDSVTIVMGTIIGSGIFIVPNLIARQLTDPYAILGVWIFGGLLSLAGALAYAELGAMIPASGGQYAYIREAFGPMAAFLCGWAYFLVVITAAIAWLSTTFSIYLSSFVPLDPWMRKAIAITLIAILSLINYRGIRAGAAVQKIFTFCKTGGIILLTAAAMLSPVNHWATAQSEPLNLSHFGIAMIACLLTYDGWVALSMVAGEVKNPQRNLPLGLLGGIGACIALFVVVNFAYLKVLTPAETAQAERVAARVAEVSIGDVGGRLVSGIILLSIIGAINGWVLSAPRLYFAQAQDGLFFHQFARVHPRYLTPGFSILAQGAWAALLCLTGTYETLGAFAMFAAWVFYGCTVSAIFVLRKKMPDAPRPYRMWGYPVLPAIFLLVAVAFLVNTVVADTIPALSGIALIATGVPAYFFWKQK